MSSVQRYTQELIVSMLNAESMGRIRRQNDADAYPILRYREYERQALTLAAPRYYVYTTARLKLPVPQEFVHTSQAMEQALDASARQQEAANLRKELYQLSAKYLEVIRSYNKAQIDQENAYLYLDKLSNNDESYKASIDLLLTYKAKMIADFEAQREKFKYRELELLKRIEELDSRCTHMEEQRREQEIYAENLSSTMRSRSVELALLRENNKDQFSKMEYHNRILAAKLTDYQHIIEKYQVLIASFDFQQYYRQIMQVVAGLREVADEQQDLYVTVQNLQTADIFDVIFYTFDETKNNLLAGNKTATLTYQLKDLQFQFSQLKNEHEVVLNGIQQTEELNQSFKLELGSYLQEKATMLQTCYHKHYQEQQALKAEIYLLKEQNEVKAAELQSFERASAKETERLRYQIIELTEAKIAQTEQAFAEKQQLYNYLTLYQQELLQLRTKTYLAQADATAAREHSELLARYLEEQTALYYEQAKQAFMNAGESVAKLQYRFDEAYKTNADLLKSNRDVQAQLTQANAYVLAKQREVEAERAELEALKANVYEQESKTYEHIAELRAQIMLLYKYADNAGADSKHQAMYKTQSEAILGEQLRGLQEQLARYDQAIQAQYIREYELNKANIYLTAANKVLDAYILALQNYNAQHAEEMRYLITEYDSQLEEKESALLLAKEDTQYYAEEYARAAEVLKETNEQLQARISVYESENEALKKAVYQKAKDLGDRLVDSQRRIAELQYELQDTYVQQAAEHAALDYKTVEMAAQVSAAAELRSELEQLQNQLKSKDQQVQGLANELRAILQESEELGADVDSEIAQFQAEIARKAQELRYEREAFHEYKTRTYDAAYLVQQCKLQAQMIGDLEDTNKSIGGENRQLRKENETLKGVNKQLRDVLGSDDIAREIKAKYAELLNSMYE